MKYDKSLLDEAPDELWEEYTLTRDPETRDQLILHYQPFLKALSRNLWKRVSWKMSYDDVVSYGQIGLIKAVDKYSLSRGPFKKFGSTLVFGAIIDQLRLLDWIPKRYRLAQKDIAVVAKGRDLTSKELAEELGWDEEVVRETLLHNYIGNVDSINRGLPEGLYTTTMIESSGSSIIKIVINAIRELPIKSQIVLLLKQYGKHTNAEIAEATGITNVSEIYWDAIEKVFNEVTHEI